MATYYHVAPISYNEGEDLLSWDAYVERYGEQPTAWKWDEADEGFDTDIVSLFTDRAEASDYIDLYMDGAAKVLTIEVGDDTDIRVRRNSEGYSCVIGRIPAEHIISVETIAA